MARRGTIEELHAAGVVLMRGRRPDAERSKVPLERGWPGIDGLTLDEALAHATGGSRVCARLDRHLVVDLDPRNFDKLEIDPDPAAGLVAAGLPLDRTLTVPTPSGGSHHWFALPDGVDPADLVGRLDGYDGVDLLSGHKHQVVAHDGCDGRTMLELPADWVERLTRPPRVPYDYDADAGLLTPERLAEVLEGLDPANYRDHDGWFKLMASCHHATDGLGVDEFVAWSTSDPDYADHAGIIEKRWRSLDSGRDGAVVTHRTLMKELSNAGRGDLADLVTRADAADDFDDDPSADAPADAGKEDRPRITVRKGQISRIAREAADALVLDRPDSILQREFELVRVATLRGDATVDGVRRREGAATLLPVEEVWLRARMDDSARWSRVERGRRVAMDPPLMYARTLLRDGELWRFPVLTALVTAPTLDVATGRPLDRPGHDAETGVLSRFDPAEFPPTEGGVGQVGAAGALDRVQHALLRDFPFASGADLAVAVSALLCGLLRPTMRTCPAHVFDAPTAGTGKTMLVDLAAILATGVEAPAMSWGKTDEETEKRLFSALRHGDRVLLMDNLEPPQRFAGDFLSSMLTQQKYRGRILGRSELVDLPTRVLLTATGNNIEVGGDVCRRTVRCRIDARLERPENRRFDWSPTETAKRDRGPLVSALLTAARAYGEAGRPCDPPHVGSFEDWTFVRGLLLWCMHDDPADTMAGIRADDTERADVAEALAAWHAVHGEERLSVADLVDAGVASTEGSEARRAWVLAVDNLAGGSTDPRWMGRGLARRKSTVAGGFMLLMHGKGGTRRFSVVRLEGDDIC